MAELKSKKRALGVLTIGLVCVLATMTTANSAIAQDQADDGGVKTGNKPSTFNYRINPYVRHNSFENDAEITDYSVFLMAPVKWFGKFDGAFVYEGPVSRDQDFTAIGSTEDTGYPDPVIRAPMIFKPFRLGKFNWIPVFIQEFTLPLGSEDRKGKKSKPKQEKVLHCDNSERK